MSVTLVGSGAFQMHRVKKDHQESAERFDVLIGEGGILSQVRVFGESRGRAKTQHSPRSAIICCGSSGMLRRPWQTSCESTSEPFLSFVPPSEYYERSWEYVCELQSKCAVLAPGVIAELGDGVTNLLPVHILTCEGRKRTSAALRSMLQLCVQVQDVTR
eukprot:761519-Hanusia_phi.AAC.2